MEATVARRPARSSLGVLLTASFVSSLIMLDSNIVAVSLPTIGRSLGASFTDMQWVISAYVLTYTALLLASGTYADLRGRRRAMLIGLLIFAGASVACGLATTSLLLNISRAIQGVGGALLLTASLAILSHTFVGAARSNAFAIWGASIGIALAVGPVMGGIITDFVGWRWIFLVNLPICVVLIASALRYVEESRDPDAKRFDVRGTVTFSIGLAMWVWALIESGDEGRTSGSVLATMFAASVILLIFMAFELHQPRPMVDLSLFGRRTFLGSLVAMLGYGASAQVMVFFLPLYLQNVYGLEPFVAGVAMIPFALPMVLAPRLVARLAVRYSGRMLLAVGLSITTVANLLFCACAWAHLPYVAFAISMLIAGCGAGLLNGQTLKVLQGAVPEERAGMASGLASTTRYVGILVSVAGLGAVLSAVARSVFVSSATAADLPTAVAQSLAGSVTAGDLARSLENVPALLQVTLQLAGSAAYASGFGAAALLAAGVAAAACILAFLLVRTEDTVAAVSGVVAPPCMTVDCRHPL